ncbi:MerR family DNA-binding protein [Streptomyces sp. NPDC001435]|uniref:MerR family DNA-binding protein n=1 Tax=Streptomyces sp. NPDC001435 TaxID=3364576 RepID=UPI0036C27E45
MKGRRCDHGATRTDVGQAAKAAGITRKAVRVYEARCLLPTAERTQAGYRLYNERDLELLTFIRRARTLGLHLDDIHDVLAVRNRGTPPCAAVRDLLDARIAELDATVAELLTLRKTLAETRKRADDPPTTSPSPSARSSRTRGSRPSTRSRDHRMALWARTPTHVRRRPVALGLPPHRNRRRCRPARPRGARRRPGSRPPHPGAAQIAPHRDRPDRPRHGGDHGHPARPRGDCHLGPRRVRPPGTLRSPSPWPSACGSLGGASPPLPEISLSAGAVPGAAADRPSDCRGGASSRTRCRRLRGSPTWPRPRASRATSS